MSHALHPAPHIGAGARIGPNAIIQTAAALRARHGDAVAEELLAESTPWRLDALPGAMVDENEVGALVRAVIARYPGHEGHAIMSDSGVRTAHYLLRVRIPALAQRVMRVLPRGIALRMLMSAISRHSWTFAGSAQFDVSRLTRNGGAFALISCPMCRGLAARAPQCHYYAATFEEIIRRIITRSAMVREVECEAAGGACCRFVISMNAPAE